MSVSSPPGTILLAFLVLAACHANVERNPPIADGDYVFAQRWEEHPEMRGGEFNVRIRGREIRVTNVHEGVFPAGVIDEGMLVWHERSQRWIVGQTPEDANAPEVGGCSDGPNTVDLKDRIYWTC